MVQGTVKMWKEKYQPLYEDQIQNYMNYVDKNIKNIDDNKTVGIIICRKNNKYVIEYCSDTRIIAREYELL